MKYSYKIIINTDYATAALHALEKFSSKERSHVRTENGISALQEQATTLPLALAAIKKT